MTDLHVWCADCGISHPRPVCGPKPKPASDEPREWDAFTAEHDSDLAYWESHVEQTRRDVLNPAEWPALDAEIRRIKELRALVQSSAAPILAAVLAEVARQDEFDKDGRGAFLHLQELEYHIARAAWDIREALRLSKEGA